MNTLKNISPEEEYVVNLPSHLAKAGMSDDYCNILTEFEFLQYKVNANGVSPLIEDYEYDQTNKELKLIQRALQMSSDVINEDKNQLAGQLLGRLLRFHNLSNIKKLLDVTKQNTPWLRPLISSLNSPKSELIHTLKSKDVIVTGVVVSPDNNFLLSSFLDGEIIIWDLVTGKKEKTLHTKADSSDLNSPQNAILGLAITPNGNKLISVLRGNFINIWDLETQKQIVKTQYNKNNNHSQKTNSNNLDKNWFSGIFAKITDMVETVKSQYSFVESHLSYLNFIQLHNPIVITPDNKKGRC